MFTMRQTISWVGFPSLAFFVYFACSPGLDAGSGDQVELSGFWYDASTPMTRGSFTASLEISGSHASGTAVFEGRTPSKLTLSGEAYDDISNGNTYAKLDLSNENAGASLYMIDFAAHTEDIDNDSTMSGSLSFDGSEETFAVYTTAAEIGALEPTTGIRIAMAEVNTIAASSDAIFAYGKANGDESTPSVYRIDGDGTVAEKLDIEIGSGLTFGNDCLYTIKEAPPPGAGFELICYAYPGYVASSVPLAGITSVGGGPKVLTADTSGIWASWGMVTKTVARFDVQTGEQNNVWPGEVWDLMDMTVAGDLFIGIISNREGYLPSIVVYDSSGATIKNWVAPTSDVSMLTSDGVSLELCDRLGNLFTVPLETIN